MSATQDAMAKCRRDGGKLLRISGVDKNGKPFVLQDAPVMQRSMEIDCKFNGWRIEKIEVV